MLDNILLVIVLSLVIAGEYFVGYCLANSESREYFVGTVLLLVNTGEYFVGYFLAITESWSIFCWLWSCH